MLFQPNIFDTSKNYIEMTTYENKDKMTQGDSSSVFLSSVSKSILRLPPPHLISLVWRMTIRRHYNPQYEYSQENIVS